MKRDTLGMMLFAPLLLVAICAIGYSTYMLFQDYPVYTVLMIIIIGVGLWGTILMD